MVSALPAVRTLDFAKKTCKRRKAGQPLTLDELNILKSLDGVVSVSYFIVKI